MRSNILFVGKCCKIADWGGSFILKSGEATRIQTKAPSTTKIYSAPEIYDIDEYFEKEKFDYYQFDVYSLGIIAMCCCGVTKTIIGKIPKIKKYHDDYIEEDVIKRINERYSKSLSDLIMEMCSFNPEKRPKIEEIYERLKW